MERIMKIVVRFTVVIWPVALAAVIDYGIGLVMDAKQTVNMLADGRWTTGEQATWGRNRLNRRRALLSKIPGIEVE